MEKSQITIFTEENMESIMDRLSFALMEIGVTTNRVSLHDDCIVFEFIREERKKE
jgi:hypothetical protein